MTPFSSLVAEFAEKTGVTPGNPGADNFDIVTDGILVSCKSVDEANAVMEKYADVVRAQIAPQANA